MPCAFSRQIITPRFCCCEMFPAQNIWLMTSHRSSFMIAQLWNRIRALVHHFQVPFTAHPIVWLSVTPLAQRSNRTFPHTKFRDRSGLPPLIFFHAGIVHLYCIIHIPQKGCKGLRYAARCRMHLHFFISQAIDGSLCTSPIRLKGVLYSRLLQWGLSTSLLSSRISCSLMLCSRRLFAFKWFKTGSVLSLGARSLQYNIHAIIYMVLHHTVFPSALGLFTLEE